MNDRRVLLAALLSAVFLMAYAQLMAQKTPPRPAHSSAVQSPAVLQPAPEPVTAYLLEKEEVAQIESESLAAEIGLSSGDIRAITLKQFKDEHGTGTLTVSGYLPILHIRSAAGELSSWKLLRSEHDIVEFQAVDQKGITYHIIYRLELSNPIVNIELSSTDSTKNNDIVLVSSWKKCDSLGQRYNSLEALSLTKLLSGKNSYKRFHPGKKEPINVPRGTSQLVFSERYFCQIIKPRSGSLDATILPANGEPESVLAATIAPVTVGISAGPANAHAFEIYFGPRDYFRLKQSHLEDAFPIGIIGQIGLILLTILSWIAGLTKNYGVAIIVFSILVTGVTAPFTLMGIRSMKRMQELKPKVDQLMAKHKGDPKRANQEVFQLYKTHRVSPLGGCLPMLLPMPIFIALFNAISHFIELRGQSFLWITDLSLPDRFARFPFSVPFLGNEFHLLPVIMAGAMYLQSRMSQRNMPSDPNNPAAAMMSGPLMSVIFGVMFYQFQSGLVLYWLMNSLASIALYRLAK